MWIIFNEKNVKQNVFLVFYNKTFIFVQINSLTLYEMRKSLLKFLVIFIICFVQITYLNAEETEPEEQIERFRNVYFNVGQGATFSRVLDKKMSNLHYSGGGAVLSFGRFSETQSFLSEWNFLTSQVNYLTPQHKATDVIQPYFGFGYTHLRNFRRTDNSLFQVGLQANLFVDMRIASRLGNSFLHMETVNEIRPKIKYAYNFYFLREWNLSFSMSFTLLGVGVRAPEYGSIFKLYEDGSSTIQNIEEMNLNPLNFRHLTTKIYLIESFRGESNPNGFKIGYIWDYYSYDNVHDLNVQNATHGLVFEYYFKTR